MPAQDPAGGSGPTEPQPLHPQAERRLRHLEEGGGAVGSTPERGEDHRQRARAVISAGLAEASLTVAFFLCVIFGDDMLAYFAGSLWGRSTCLHLPVSPNKSAVGFAGGVAGAVIVALLFHWLAGGFPHRGLWLDLAIAAAIGIVGIVGDLVESGLKRSAGVKDSGVIIPGRGGILDSVDSLALAAPLCFCLLLLVPAA